MSICAIASSSGNHRLVINLTDSETFVEKHCQFKLRISDLTACLTSCSFSGFQRCKALLKSRLWLEVLSTLSNGARLEISHRRCSLNSISLAEAKHDFCGERQTPSCIVLHAKPLTPKIIPERQFGLSGF